MRILVTGGSGFLGSRIVKAYDVAGKYKVFAPGHREMDLQNQEDVDSAFKAVRPDVVIHCAAASDVAWCGRNPELSWKINVEGTDNIAGACGRWGAKLVFCSSDQVYFGSKVTEAHREDETLAPANVYGKQKLEGEKRCLDGNKNSVILRLSWMYDRGKLSENEHGNFMQTFLEAREKGKKLIFPIYDFRGITDIRPVVENLEKVFALPAGIYNYGSENDYSTYETVRLLLKGTGISNMELEENREAFADAPRNLRMDGDKMRRYGIVFPGTLEGLMDALKQETL